MSLRVRRAAGLPAAPSRRPPPVVRRRDRRRADGDTRVRRHVPERQWRTCDYNQGSLTEGRQVGIEDRLYKRILSRRDSSMY